MPLPPPKSKASTSTLEEAKYLRRLIDAKTPISVHLKSGEVFDGKLEYYDRTFIRLTRDGAANLFLFKHDIKYIRETPE